MTNACSLCKPETGSTEQEKDALQEELVGPVRQVVEGDSILNGANLNEHVGKLVEGCVQEDGGYGYGRKNVDGEKRLKIIFQFRFLLCQLRLQKRGRIAGNKQQRLERQRDRLAYGKNVTGNGCKLRIFQLKMCLCLYD